MWQEKESSARTLLQNSMTTLGEANAVGAVKVAGLVRDSFGTATVDFCWSQSAQFGSGSAIDCDWDETHGTGARRGESGDPPSNSV